MVRLNRQHSVCTALGAPGDQTTHTWNVRPQALTPAASTNESHWTVDGPMTPGLRSGVFGMDHRFPVPRSRCDSVASSRATQPKTNWLEAPKISAINGRFGAGAWRFARRTSQADEPQGFLLTHGLHHRQHEGENHYHSRQLVSGSWPGAFCCSVNISQPKTPEQRPRVMDQSRTFQWLVVVEAAGVGTWGRTFQV